MSVVIETAPKPSATPSRERRLQKGAIKDRYHRLRIGLINNMPDAAVEATERQFVDLIGAASADFDVRFVPIALDTLPRSDAAREKMAPTYRDPKHMRAASLDALIITGAEPRTADLTQEPYWAELTAIFDWARGGVHSALYSCLAAHALALHRDEIPRRRLPRKLSGVYQSEPVVEHELTGGLERVSTPHSRYNALAECDLEAKGYTILARSPVAGPDVFVKDKGLLEVFWQGHPEYEADTLAREFRRDSNRFFDDAGARPPRPPQNYFDDAALERIQQNFARASACGGSEPSLGSKFDPCEYGPTSAPWRASAVRLAAAWLQAVSRRKAVAAAETFARVRWGG